uniref:Uncharacterized protein n=1 Tax=Pavo cristatus TaxID=9049 RepID=A0A8C9F4V1_PAVCR
MENVMLEYAALDRELNHYMRAIEETIKQDKPEKIPDLKSLVKEKFTALESMNSDSDLEKNEKYMYFKDQLKDMKKQFRLQSDSNDNDDIEQIDEDIAVTQSQMNFICPITQVCYHTIRDWERAISCPSLDSDTHTAIRFVLLDSATEDLRQS